jgi:hypothetical protein
MYMNEHSDKRARAKTDKEKELVLLKLLIAWKQVPELRLGQLIAISIGRDPFYVEDFDIVDKVEREVSRMKEG